MATLAETSVTSEAVEQALRGRLAGDLLTDRFSQAAYATAACIYKIRPLAIVLPKNADDVVATVKAAADLGVSVIAARRGFRPVRAGPGHGHRPGLYEVHEPPRGGRRRRAASCACSPGR